MSISGRHKKTSALIVHFRFNAHFRADIYIARFDDYLRKMLGRQIPIMRPKTTIVRSGGYQRFRKVNVRTPVATYRFMYC